MRARYLADKSALARMPLAQVRTRLAPLIAQVTGQSVEWIVPRGSV